MQDGGSDHCPCGLYRWRHRRSVHSQRDGRAYAGHHRGRTIRSFSHTADPISSPADAVYISEHIDAVDAPSLERMNVEASPTELARTVKSVPCPQPNAMTLFHKQRDYGIEAVPQECSERINHPEANPRIPTLFAARATIMPEQGHHSHRHPGRNEIIRVLSSHTVQRIGQGRMAPHAGRAHASHASFNIGDEPAVLFVVLPDAQSVKPMAIDVSGKAPWNSPQIP